MYRKSFFLNTKYTVYMFEQMILLHIISTVMVCMYPLYECTVSSVTSAVPIINNEIINWGK